MAEKVRRQGWTKAVKFGWSSGATRSAESRPVVPDGSNLWSPLLFTEGWAFASHVLQKGLPNQACF